MSRVARQQGTRTMNSALLNYYEAIEQASQDMLEAARIGDWDHVVKLEGACALLIASSSATPPSAPLGAEEAQLKSRIMQRILVNDAEIRQLAEPWLEDLDDMLAGRAEDDALSRTPHGPRWKPGPRRSTRWPAVAPAWTSSASPPPREIARAAARAAATAACR